jgi:DNA-binding protein HU-beta
MNKNDLVKEISRSLNLSQKDVLRAVDTITDVITEAMAQDVKVSLRDFGSFSVLERKSRNGINPKTGKKIKIEKKKVVKFNVSKQLKAMVKK